MNRKTLGALALLIGLSTVVWMVLRRQGAQESGAPGAGESPVVLDADSGPEALIRASLQAYGGAARVAALQSLVLENEVTVYGVEESRAHGHSTECYRFPDKVRVDFTFGEEAVTQIYDGLQAWIFQGGRVAKAPDYLTESLRRSVKHFPGLLLPAALDEHALLGHVVSGNSGAREILGLTVTDPEGDQSRLWFDRGSGLLARIDYAVFSSLGSDSMRVEMSDYREIDGIQTAFSAIIWYDGEKAQETRVTSARRNPDLPDSLFAIPSTGDRPATGPR